MTKSVKLRLAISASVSLMLLMSAVATVLAGWVNLTHGHACGPTQGNFTWSQSYNTNDVTWYQYAKWSGSQYNCIQGAGDWYQLEAEAYNPAGGGTSCDKLHTYSTSYTLPLRSSPSVANGCGSTTYKEETKFPIKSSSIGNNVEYWTLTRNYKYNAVNGQVHEVNWSFSNLATDWWAGKVRYRMESGAPYFGYFPTCASPSGILSGYPGC